MNPPDIAEKFLVFGAPRIEQAEIDAVTQVLESGWLGTGPRVAEFEKLFADYLGHGYYPVAVNSCTAALHLSYLAANIGPGDEVITTPLTFCATVNAIMHVGATPVLADIDPDTLNIDPAEIRRRITPRTKAVVPVHFAGRACDMDAIMQIAGEHQLRVIEDCAHSIETLWKGRHAGTIGDFGCFSFYVTKNIVTGEGGMILARSEQDANRLKTLALHGMSKDAWKRFSDDGYKHYQVVECGFKYNMMDLQAAIGIQQMARVDEYWLRREEVWQKYNLAFSGLPIGLPPAPQAETRHARHLYTIMIDKDRCGISRDEFLQGMTENGIGVGVHYQSIPEHPLYQKRFGWSVDQFPHAGNAGREIVSIPVSARLSDRDVGRVITSVKKVLRIKD